jgi:hypothetical protein
MSTAKNIMSMTSLRRTIQRMEQLTNPVAGTNSERRKRHRRWQMLLGKLGEEARDTAHRQVLDIFHSSGSIDAQTACNMYIYGKEVIENAKPIGTEPTHPASS